MEGQSTQHPRKCEEHNGGVADQRLALRVPCVARVAPVLVEKIRLSGPRAPTPGIAWGHLGNRNGWDQYNVIKGVWSGVWSCRSNQGVWSEGVVRQRRQGSVKGVSCVIWVSTLLNVSLV